MSEYPGREARELAAALTEDLRRTAGPALAWAGIDLRPSAEHFLYTALRRPAHHEPEGMLSAVRPLVRLARATYLTRRWRGPSPAVDVLVLVTQPVHASLFVPIERELGDATSAILVDARTRGSHNEPIAGTRCRLAAHLELRQLPSLVAHAMTVQLRLRTAPSAWGRRVDASTADSLLAILRRGLPLAALDAAHIDAMIPRHRAGVVACFSESGILARIAPVVGRRRGVAVVDLPHADAADPWGTVGADYDGVAVYGPRAAEVMRVAGVPIDRIVQIGPLRYDAILSTPRVASADAPRRVIFASQPADPSKRALHPEVKRATLRAALAVAEALSPAELVVVPHPTEHDTIAEEELATMPAIEGVAASIARAGGLHDVLPGAWVLVTGSSQSVFDAVLSGIPAITANLTGGSDPVAFATDGIALGATSAEEAGTLADGLRDPDARRGVVEAARASIGGSLGPLDGSAGARAAAWLRSFVNRADRAGSH